jgi:GntR family transcriptional regulator
MIVRTSPIPLYFQLAEDLRAEIQSHARRPGSKLPTESELCEAHGVSRSVVRQALQRLAQQNLIETERGRGAFVLERKVPIEMAQQLDPLQESMEKAGFKLTTKVLQQQRIKAPAYIAEQIGDDQAVLIKRLRFADGLAFLVVHNYLPYRRVPGLAEFDGLASTSLYRYLAERHNLIASTGTRQVELVRLDDAAIAADLQVPLDGYVLFNRELTYDQHKTVIEYYESWHHPDRTKLHIELQRKY